MGLEPTISCLEGRRNSRYATSAWSRGCSASRRPLVSVPWCLTDLQLITEVAKHTEQAAESGGLEPHTLPYQPPSKRRCRLGNSLSIMSRKLDLNQRPRPYQGRVPPLNYYGMLDIIKNSLESRILLCLSSSSHIASCA